jgi:hypothetical protein
VPVAQLIDQHVEATAGVLVGQPQRRRDGVRQQRLVPQPVEPQQQATVGEACGGRARRGQAHRGLAHPGQPGHGDQRGSVQHAPDRGGLGGAAHQASRV